MAIYINKGWKYLGIAAVVAIVFTVYYILTTGYHINEFKALPQQLAALFGEGRVLIDQKQYDVGRFGMWMMALRKVFVSWGSLIFGVGPAANFGRKYPLHNEYVAMWFEFGLIGLALMIGYIVTTVKMLSKSGNRLLLTSFTIAFLDMMGNSSLHIAPTAFLIIIVCGLIERERLNQGGMGTPEPTKS
jgi:hypothetical protein